MFTTPSSLNPLTTRYPPSRKGRAKAYSHPMVYLTRCSTCHEWLALMPIAGDPRAKRIPVLLTYVLEAGDLFWTPRRHVRHYHPKGRADSRPGTQP